MSTFTPTHITKNGTPVCVQPTKYYVSARPNTLIRDMCTLHGVTPPKRGQSLQQVANKWYDVEVSDVMRTIVKPGLNPYPRSSTKYVECITEKNGIIIVHMDNLSVYKKGE